MKKYLIGLVVLFTCCFAYAEQPTCHSHSGGNYCKYNGPVKSLYINSGNVILIYFDVPANVDEANSYGMNISQGSAAALKVDENPEFAKMLYSTVLTAHVAGRDIDIQMRGSQSGYLKVDRIWLNQ